MLMVNATVISQLDRLSMMSLQSFPKGRSYIGSKLEAVESHGTVGIDGKMEKLQPSLLYIDCNDLGAHRDVGRALVLQRFTQIVELTEHTIIEGKYGQSHMSAELTRRNSRVRVLAGISSGGGVKSYLASTCHGRNDSHRVKSYLASTCHGRNDSHRVKSYLASTCHGRNDSHRVKSYLASTCHGRKDNHRVKSYLASTCHGRKDNHRVKSYLASTCHGRKDNHRVKSYLASTCHGRKDNHRVKSYLASTCHGRKDNHRGLKLISVARKISRSCLVEPAANSSVSDTAPGPHQPSSSRGHGFIPISIEWPSHNGIVSTTGTDLANGCIELLVRPNALIPSRFVRHTGSMRHNLWPLAPLGVAPTAQLVRVTRGPEDPSIVLALVLAGRSYRASQDGRLSEQLALLFLDEFVATPPGHHEEHAVMSGYDPSGHIRVTAGQALPAHIGSWTVTLFITPTSPEKGAHGQNLFPSKPNFPSGNLLQTPKLKPSAYPGINPTHLPGIMPSHYPGIMPSHYPGIMPSHYPGIMPSHYPGMMASNYPNFLGMIASQFPNYQGMMASQYPWINPTKLPGIMPSHYPGMMASNYPNFLGMIASQFPNYQGMMASQYPWINPTNLPGIMPSHYHGMQNIMPSHYHGMQNIMATRTFPSMGTSYGGFQGPSISQGRQLPSITNILTIAEFEEARKLPQVSCVTSLAYRDSSPDLLDSQTKLDSYGRGLQGDKLALFQQLTSSPDYDLSIFTGEILDEALEHLLNLGTREREIFLEPRSFLSDMNNFLDVDFLEQLFASWIPKIRLLQTKDVMCEVQSMVPYELLGELCDHLLHDDVTAIETTLINERCADCTALLVFERWNGNHTGKLEGIKGKTLYSKLRQMRVDWDIYMLRFTPRAVRPSDIDRISPSNFGDDFQLAVLTDEYVMQHLSSAVKTRIALKLEAAHGPFPTWSPVLSYHLGHYIMFLPAEELDDRLEPAMIIELEVMPEEICSKDRKIQKFYSLLAWKAAEWLSDPLNIPPEFSAASLDVKAKFFCLITKYAALPHLYGTVFDSTIITHGMSECRHYDIDYSKMDFLVDAVSSDPGFKWTANVMVDLDPLMPAVPASVLKNISAMELKAYWEEKDAEFPVSSARTVWDQIKHTVDLHTMDCHDMMTAREGLLVFSPDELKRIPLHVFTECASIFTHYLDERCEHNPRGCEQIWRLMKDSASFMSVNLASLMKNMTQEFIADYVPPDDMEELMTRDDKDLEEILQIPLDDVHASVVFRKVEREMGNFSLMDMEHHNVSDKRAYHKLFRKGATTEELERELPKGAALLSSMDEMKENLGKASQKKVKTVYNKVKESLTLDTRRSSDVCVDETMTEDVAPFFTQASEEDLNKLSPDSREKILKAIGSDDRKSEDEDTEPGEYVEGMTRRKLKLFLDVQLKTKGFDVKSQLTPQDVEEVGPYLLCGMDEAVQEKLTDAAVKEYLSVFEGCVQLRQTVRESLAQRVINSAGGVKGLMDKPSMVKDLGTMLAYADPQELDGLDQDKLEKFELHMTDMMNKGEDRSKKVKSKSEADIPTEELAREEGRRSDLLKRMFVKTKPAAGNDPLDCNSLKVFRGELSFLNASDIRDMRAQDFEDCLEDLQKPEWDDRQLEAIGHKLKDLFGNETMGWQPDAPMKAGSLIRALPKDDLLDITFTEDILAVLGQMEMEANESAEILNKFARDKGIRDLSAATADELASMGKLVCGMDPSIISMMSAGTISDAASSLADADCLAEEQLQEFGKKLEEDLGSDWSVLPTNKIAELGVLVGGASKEALQSLDEEQLANVNPKAISKMPAKTFSEAFSADKLAELSDEQALYLTPKHMWRMSREQREAMSNFTQRAGITVPTASHGNKISENSQFVGARQLPRASCGSGLALAGQRDNLLDTPQKVDTYRRSLQPDLRELFNRLEESPLHDISTFTDIDMDVTLDFLMGYLDEEGREDYLDILDSFEYIPTEDMEEILATWPPSIHLLQTEDTMCQMTSMMSEPLLSTFCTRLTDDDVSAATLTEIVERCADCVVLAYEYRQDPSLQFMLDPAKGAVFFRKLRQWRRSDWDISTLRLSPGGLKEADIDLIVDSGVFRNMSQLTLLAEDEFFYAINDGVKKKLAQRIYEVLGRLDTWTDAMIDRIGSYIPYMRPAVLKRDLTPSYVMRVLHHIEDMEDVTEIEHRALSIAAWSLADHVESNPNFLNSTEKLRALCLLAKYAAKRSLFETYYTAAELSDGLARCAHWNISKENSGKAMAVVLRDPSFDWTPGMVELVSNFSAAVTPATLKRMNDSTLEHNWEHLRESNLSSTVLKSAWNRMKSSYTLGVLSCNDLHAMGRMVFAMSLRELDSVPGSALLDCVTHLSHILDGACDGRKPFCSKMWEKIKEAAQSFGTPLRDVVTSVDPEFLQYIPSEDFNDMSLSDLGGIDNLDKLRLDPAQSSVVMKAIEREFGPVSSSNLNYTGRQVEKMGAVFFQGASLESLENLPEGSELMESLPAIMENLEFMNEKKLKVVYDKLQNVLGMGDTQSADVCLDDSIVKQAVGFFTQASGDDMRKLAPETRRNMLTEIGKNGDLVKNMGREGIREHFQVLKETEDLESKSQLTADDLEKYGAHLFCGMEEADVDKLSADAVEQNLADFDECEQLDNPTRQALADKVLESSNGLSGLMADPEKLESMGTLLLNVDLSEASALPQDKKERLGSMVGTIMEDVNHRVREREQRSGGDIPSREKEEEKMLQNEMTRKLWDVVADTVDCQTIQGFHGDLSFLSPSDIENLDPDVVAECVSEFQEADWDVEQLEKFAMKIKYKYGNDTSAWDKDVVMQAGKLISGLETEDIEKLTLDTDIIEVLGKSKIKEPEKMFKKFVADQGIGSMGSLDSDTLRGMGKMVCGMTPAEMRDLQGSVVLDVTIDLSSAADCLDEDQLKVIGEKLDAAGPPDYWENANMEEMGMLAAGMTASNIEKLDEDQLSAIDPKAIKLMDEDTFTEAFKPEKLSKLSPDQVTSISPKALRKMDIGQLIAMENVANGVSDVNATVEAEEKKSRFKIDIPTNVSVRSLDTFVEVRNLNSRTSMSGMAFAGQSKNKLDTQDKRTSFIDSLSADARAFFQRILSSADHDVSGFTTFELRKVLDFLMNELDSSDRDTYLNLRTQFSSLPREDVNRTVTTWPPQIHLLMKPTLMCETLGQMDLEVLNNFCKHLTSDEVSTATVIEMLNRCGDCLAAANASRVNDDIIGLISGFKGRVFLDKLQQWKPNDWDIYHLMFAPDSLKPADVNLITNMDNFRDISQLYRLGDPDFYEKISRKVMVKLAKKLKNALGAPSTWSYLHYNLLLPYIVNMPPKVLKNDLTASMVIAMLPNYDLVKDIVNKKFMKIAAWKVSNYLIANADSVSADIKQQAICLVLEFSTHKKLWTKVYSERELFNYLSECSAFGVSDKRLNEVIRKIVRASSFEWTQAAIETLGPLISAVPPSVLKQVNASLLLDNWEQIKNSNFTANTLRMLWRRFRDLIDLPSADCDTIKLLGRVFLSLTTAEMKTIPDSALSACVDHIGPLMEDSCDENKWFCKKVWEKIKTYATGQGTPVGELVQHLGDGFLRHLPEEDIEAINIQDVGGVEVLKDLEISSNYAPILMRKVAQEKGTVSMDNTNYTAGEIIKMGKVFFHGATGPEFEALPEDPSLLDMLPHMAEFFEDLNEKKIEIVFNKLKKILAMDSESNIWLDDALAEQIAMFFTAATGDDLRRFSETTRKVILQTMGKEYSYVKKMTRQRAQELFDVMMEVDNLGSKSSYEEEDISDYGYMWCGQKKEQASKFTDTAVDGMMTKIKDCVHLESGTREALVSKAVSLSGGLGQMLADSPQRLEDMGSMVLDLDLSQVNALDDSQKQVLVSSTKKVMESVTDVQTQAKTRPDSEISQSEKAQDDTKLQRFGKVVFDLHLSVTFSRRRRRRRSLSSADCATIQSFNGALSFLSAADILSLDNNEFTDCIAEFQTTTWTADQLSAFQTQLTTAFGSNTTAWTKTNVVDSGILLDGLTSVHVLSFSVLDDDAVSTLGTYVYTNNAEHLVASFLDTNGITDVSTIDAATLGNMGNLVCGFNSTQMASLDSTAVDGASNDLASVTCLTSDQLIALANKIVEVRGTDWTAVTSDTVSSLGVLAGGLPVSVLEDLGSDQIASITTAAVAAIDPTTFATVFTVEKIGYMSSAQANSVTSDQQAQLSTDQLDALMAVATTTTAADGSDNGSMRLVLAPAMVLLATLVSLLATNNWMA
ncbi:hypothetical protein RRG08_022825 [Elysia crispata]|uniref:Uncharacterized protein n=1 Tax=Elysia crispata TaxID=231223 RepID=A0AAE0Z1T4_9GAST|nr:hypothetical protein RRG08_022825 [Elysia crispata]